ncbi:MAG: hypothetical protein WED11_05175 [Natronospirillum sp.]
MIMTGTPLGVNAVNRGDVMQARIAGEGGELSVKVV